MSGRFSMRRLRPVSCSPSPGPEALQDLHAVLASAGDLVEDVLELGGEAVVDQPAEVLLHQADDAERDPGRHQRRALLVDVAAVLDGADDRGVGGRPPDLPILQLLDEAGLGEAGRRLGLVAGRAELVDGDGVALRHVGQLDLLVVALLVGVVAGLDVRLEEAVERDRPARAGELHRLAGGRVGADAQRDRLALGVLHLRRDGALPDELVQPGLVAGQAGPAAACGTTRRRDGWPRAPPGRS